MIKIHNNRIDNFNKTFIIAEIGLSHEGSLGLAKYFIDLSVRWSGCCKISNASS